MIHIAVSQAYRFAQISGKPMPFEVPKTIDKTRAKEIWKQRLAQSFDFCIGLLAEFPPEQMDKPYEVGWFEDRKSRGGNWCWACSHMRRIIAGRLRFTCARMGSNRRRIDFELWRRGRDGRC